MTVAPEHVVIIGGGTAGWMTACFLAKTWSFSDTTITLVESDTISTVGVGEGSTPYLRQFFAYLGVAEHQWMPACSATYKMGITFGGWNIPKEQSSYFHPFFSELDIPTADAYFKAVNERRNGQNGDVDPSHYFTAPEMVAQNITPDLLRSKAHIDYAYHFDAGKLATFLKQYATTSGVNHIIDDVTQVENADATIHAIHTQKNGALKATLFVDCSGFRGVMAKKALNRPFHSYADTLFNDAAVALPTSRQSNPTLRLQTKSMAANHGWRWEIPLTNRIGNGYVYCSSFCDKNEAEQELRHILQADENNDARHLNMHVGRLSQHWQGNCLAIGLSQGFIEPLEATALMLVQYALHHFVDCWTLSTPLLQRQYHYNNEINRMFDGIRDYIAAHYLLNTRDDTPYWQACRHEMAVPDTLSYLLNAWDKGADFEHALNEVDRKLVYLRPSWYCLFAGMQRFNSSGLQHAEFNQPALQRVKQTLKQHF